jgi:transaldolase
MTLRLFLDSADPVAWQRWLPSGLFHGVTTNPTLLKRAGQPCTLPYLQSLTLQALDLGCREVHLQAWGKDAEALQECGSLLARFGPEDRIVVKLPVTEAGIAAGHRLIEAGVPITFTACYEIPQVLLAAALGARYIAPYLGRISDMGREGHVEVIEMQRTLAGVGASVRLLVASLRQPSDLTTLAVTGIDTFTIGPPIAASLFSSEATAAAAAQFEWDASGERDVSGERHASD